MEDQEHHYVVQDENDFERAIFAITDTPSQTLRTSMIKIPVVLEGKETEMELDKGVAVSIISHADYCKLFKHIPLMVAKWKLGSWELAKMQSEGIIVPVDFSEWATPLVCVPKPDGTVCLCGDYRTTVNKSIHTDQFPIPTAEEIHQVGKDYLKSISSVHTNKCY